MSTRYRELWRAFVERHGWRAWALPVLTLVTLAFLLGPVLDGSAAGSSGARLRGFPASADGPAARRAARTASVAAGTSEHRFSAGGEDFRTLRLHRGDDGVACVGNRYPSLVLVDLSRQHLWICDRQRELRETAVTTGNVSRGDATPVGSWRVQAKQRDRWLVGPGYRDHVRFWMPFDGDFGLHNAAWQTMPFGSPRYRTHGSHGCVHLPTPMMAWVYRWARVGQTVVTVRH